jgi:hypothetical protein
VLFLRNTALGRWVRIVMNIVFMGSTVVALITGWSMVATSPIPFEDMANALVAVWHVITIIWWVVINHFAVVLGVLVGGGGGIFILVYTCSSKHSKGATTTPPPPNVSPVTIITTPTEPSNK